MHNDIEIGVRTFPEGFNLTQIELCIQIDKSKLQACGFWSKKT
jgi:hypothetical protein